MSKVVTIVTSAAQKELLTPALLAIVSPIVIGFVFGLEALAGFLAGVILVGQLMAVFQSNAGGAWDNAKKTIEDEPRDLAKNTGKGSERHKASVVGDTIGDPLKDTSGPALNPLIKVINLVSVIAATMMLTKAGRRARQLGTRNSSGRRRPPDHHRGPLLLQDSEDRWPRGFRAMLLQQRLKPALLLQPRNPRNNPRRSTSRLLK